MESIDNDNATYSVAQTEIAVQSGSITPLFDQLLKAQAGALLAVPNAKFSIEPHKFEAQFKLPQGTLNLGLHQYDKLLTTSAAFAVREKPWDRMWPTISQLRAKGLTQKEVAKLIGASQPTISRLEKLHKQ